MKQILICMAIAAAATFTAPAFAASPVEQAQAQLAEVDLQSSLATLDHRRVSGPQDAETRFARGLAMAKLNKTEDAMKVFADLTRDYPQLPEPYNNLAVLYAEQGNYEKARDALETALATHPTYAVAQENLGDIYAALAGTAYDRAVTLDTSNRAVRDKQGLISQRNAGIGAASGSVTADAAAPAPKASTTLAVADAASVNEALLAWAEAWSARDVTAYLAQYSPAFVPTYGLSRQAWAQQRRDRISHANHIAVRVLNPETVQLGDHVVRVRFVQEYQSDTYSDQVNKVLEFRASSSGWKIVREFTH